MKTNIMTKIANFTKKTIDRTTASLKDMKEIYDDLPQETKDGCKLTAGCVGLSVASSIAYKKNKKAGLAMYGGAIAMYVASLIKYDQGCEHAERDAREWNEKWNKDCERMAKDIIMKDIIMTEAPKTPSTDSSFEKEVKKAAEEAEQKAKEPKVIKMPKADNDQN